MMGVYIVKGKVTLSANLMAAAIKRHPNYTFRVKEHTTSGASSTSSRTARSSARPTSRLRTRRTRA
jgi:hypothetical protein